MFRWKQKIEEFTPTIQYVQGRTNVEADALNRLPVIDEQGGLEVMLKYPRLDPSSPILNSYPLDLTIVNKYQYYGHVPPKNIRNLSPWEEVHVDMIGPWKAIINNFEYQFRAVTCIDAIVNLPEVIPVEDTKSKTVAQAFEDNWLIRYPRPRSCIHDNDNEFIGPEFQKKIF